MLGGSGSVMQCRTFAKLAVAALLIAPPLGIAKAADMPVKAKAAPAFDWNGIYIGAYAGAAWMDQATTTDPCRIALLAFCTAAGVGTFNGIPPTGYDMDPSFLGGGTVGANWQPNPYTLLGLENNFGYLHIKGSIAQNPPPIFIGDTFAVARLGDWYDALTARLGAVDGHVMFYVKGGGAAVAYKAGVVDTVGVTLDTTTTKTLFGWAAGVGLEYAIDMHWSAKAEYLVLGVAKDVFNCGPTNTGLTECTTIHTPGIQTISLGLNYRFR